MKLSPIFEASEPPMREGAYQVFDTRYFSEHWYAYWDGKAFGYRALTPKDAFYWRHRNTICPTRTKWRGIKEDEK